MKKTYVKPRTIRVKGSLESVMYSYSTAITGGYPNPNPPMGTDETTAGSGIPPMGNDAKRYWGI